MAWLYLYTVLLLCVPCRLQTPPGVTKVESVVGTVKERPMAKVSAIASQVIDAGASDSALPASPIADKTAAQTAVSIQRNRYFFNWNMSGSINCTHTRILVI